MKPPPRARQAFLPGLGDDEGWTVFGPQDEPEQERAAPAEESPAEPAEEATAVEEPPAESSAPLPSGSPPEPAPEPVEPPGPPPREGAVDEPSRPPWPPLEASTDQATAPGPLDGQSDERPDEQSDEQVAMEPAAAARPEPEAREPTEVEPPEVVALPTSQEPPAPPEGLPEPTSAATVPESTVAAEHPLPTELPVAAAPEPEPEPPEPPPPEVLPEPTLAADEPPGEAELPAGEEPSAEGISPAPPEEAPERQEPAPAPAPASSSLEPRPRKRSPLPWAIVLLIAIGTAIVGVWAAHLRGPDKVLAGDGAPASAPEGSSDATSSSEEVQRLEGELAALRGELEQVREDAQESQQLRDELEATRTTMSGRIESLEADLDEARERLAQQESATPGPATLAVAPQPATEVAVSPSASSEEHADTPEPDWDLVRARGFDAMLTALESGRAGEGLRRLESLRAQGAFPPEAPAGGDLLDALAEGWLALETAESADASGLAPPDEDRLAQADEQLHRVRELREGFEARAAGWLPAGGEPGAASARLARLDRAVDGLAQRVTAASAGIEAMHADDWRWIQGLGVPQDPALVVRHAARFGCDHVAALLDASLEVWTRRCVRDDEVLVQQLGAEQDLGAWGERSLAVEPADRSASQTATLWLWYARRWYVDGDDAASFDWRGLAVADVLAPRQDWKAELRLAVRLALPGSGWPPPAGSVALYRIEAPGPACWRVDSVEHDGSQGAPTRLRRRHFDSVGAPLGGTALTSIERDGQTFRYGGSDAVLVDLRRAGADVSVAPWPLLTRRALPELVGVDLDSLTPLATDSEATAAPCLVQREGEWTRWLAPGAGLVIEERAGPDGTVRIELVALGSGP